MKLKFPHIRSDSNFWRCGMGFAFFLYILFAGYCIYYQYTKIRIYKLRQKRIRLKDDGILLQDKPGRFHCLNKVIKIPYTTDMISIKLILFIIFFSITNLYFAILFDPYTLAPYHPGIIDRRAAFTGMVDWSIVFILIQRNSFLPRICGLSFEELMPLHRIISRIGIINFLPHLIYRMHYAFFLRYSIFDMFFMDMEYTTGSFAMWASIALFFTSFEYIRRYHFEVFYYSHVLFVTVAILGTLFHYPTCFVFFLPATLLWISDRTVRTWKSWFIPSSFVHVDLAAVKTDRQEGIVRITVENPVLSSFYPGQYLFVAMMIKHTFWERCEWHPFTISEIFHVPKKRIDCGNTIESQPLLLSSTTYASIDTSSLNEHDQKIHGFRQRHQLFGDGATTYATIHIKALGSKTQRLLESIDEKKKDVKIYIDGLYGPRLPYQDFRILGLFATGIGVTPALVIMKDVIDKRYQGMYSVSVNKIYMTWSIRHTDEIEPFVDLFKDWAHKAKNALLPIQLFISIYVTKMKTGTTTTNDLFKLNYGARPNVMHIMDRIQKENSTCSRVWTHVCGPTSFTRDVINGAVEHQFQVHHETFEF